MLKMAENNVYGLKLYLIGYGAIQQKEMNNPICPTVKNVWNDAMHVLDTTAYHMGHFQPQSPSVKEFHGSAFKQEEGGGGCTNPLSFQQPVKVQLGTKGSEAYYLAV